MDRKAIIAAGFLALCASPTQAEPYSLEQAIDYALTHNPELRAVRAGVAAAGANAKAATGARLPELNFNYIARRSDNPLDAFADKLNTRRVDPATDFSADALNHPGTSTLHSSGLSLQWPLYTGGRTSATIREAQQNDKAAQLDFVRAQQIIAFQTLQAYRMAQAAADALAIADDAVRAAEAHANTTAKLLRERRIVASDKLSADVNLALIQSQRERAATHHSNTLSRLKLVMGLPLDTEVTLTPWTEDNEAPAPESLETIELRALGLRPDVLAQQAVWEANRARVQGARAAHKPQVNVIASESWYDDNLSFDNNSRRLMGVVSANLYRGGRDTHQISAASHQANAAEMRLEALRQQARHEVREAYQALSEARARVAICADNIGKAKRSVELVRGRYGEGRTILIDLLQAERVLVEARNEKLSATLNLSVAEAALRLAEGSIRHAP